jgi:DNA adenine methylase
MSPDILSPIEKAARFFYLNRFCFNGVYRTNMNGDFNVPRGVRTGRFPTEKHFYRCSIALRKAKILNSDFESTLSMVKARDFVYLDPPYATNDRRYRGEYGNNCFQYKDVERLLKSIDSISKIGAFFLLSYSYSEDLVNSISKIWNFRIIDVRRHVSGFAKDREVVKELIVSNFSFGG